MKVWFLTLIALFAFGLTACKDKKVVEAEKIVKEWIGKTIVFPENFQCNVLGHDTVQDICNSLHKEYNILLYVDSTGCSSCRLKLPEWKQLIAESDSLFQGQIGFLLFFQPKNKKEINFLLKGNNFRYPVFIDMSMNIDHLNHFPKQQLYQCFLLDKDNQVMMIGNPVFSPKIWELYKEMISKNKTSQQQNLTSVEVDKTEYDFGNITVGKSKEIIFRLKNTGTYPLIINNVSASCGCTIVEWDKQPTKQRETSQIKVKIKPDEEGYFNKTVNVFCNTEKQVKLIVCGTANKQSISSEISLNQVRGSTLLNIFLIINNINIKFL
jgi:hypothetical protein